MKIADTLYAAMLAVPALALTACSADEPNPGPQSAATVFTVSPDELTRAGETLSVDELQYSVYDSTGKFLFGDTSTGAPAATLSGDVFTLILDLVKGRQYQVVFWAVSSQLPEGAYVFDREAGTVTIDYSKVPSNSSTGDAFFNTATRVGGSGTGSVSLFRPFSQINIGTSQNLPTGLQSKIEIDGVPNVIDLRTGAVSGSVTFTSTLAAPPTADYPVTDPAGLKYVAMGYVLSTDCAMTPTATEPEKILKNVTLGYTIGDKSNSKSFNSVPMLYNHRVNIFGKVLDESDVTIDTEIDPTPGGGFDIQI